MYLILPYDLRFIFDVFLSLGPMTKVRGRFIMIWHIVAWSWSNDKFFIIPSTNVKELEDKSILLA